MNPEEMTHSIHKALEVWTLQNVCDGAILLSFVVLALVAGRAYLEAMKKRLTLRVAVEVWGLTTDIGVDLVLFGIALVGLFVVNNDIMADIKIALPWVPLAFVLMTVALVVRTLHGGREIGTRAWWVVLGLLSVACLSAWFGFTFVMETAGEEYLALHPGAHVWEALARMRSDRNPDLAMATFLWANPLMMLTFGWAVVVGIARTLQGAQNRRAVVGVQESKERV